MKRARLVVFKSYPDVPFRNSCLLPTCGLADELKKGVGGILRGSDRRDCASLLVLFRKFCDVSSTHR